MATAATVAKRLGCIPNVHWVNVSCTHPAPAPSSSPSASLSAKIIRSSRFAIGQFYGCCCCCCCWPFEQRLSQQVATAATQQRSSQLAAGLLLFCQLNMANSQILIPPHHHRQSHRLICKFLSLTLKVILVPPAEMFSYAISSPLPPLPFPFPPCNCQACTLPAGQCRVPGYGVTGYKRPVDCSSQASFSHLHARAVSKVLSRLSSSS